MKLLTIVLLILPVGLLANVTTSSDEDYYVLESASTRYIFPQSRQNLLSDLVPRVESLHQVYKKEFAWELDETFHLVLASPMNQTGNAFATVMPNNLSVFYGGGAPYTESFATSNWLRLLAAHEPAHLYQLNVKHGLSKVTKTIFGNTLYFPIFFFPFIWVHPNVLMPDLFIEGNATWNESRFQVGGRLESPELRALVYQLVLDNKLTPGRLLNPYLTFPYGSGKYYLGAYFYRYIAETFPEKTVNMHFSNNASAYLWPFLLNRGFYKTFQVKLKDALKDFVEDLRKKAQGLQTADGQLLTSSLVDSEITRSGKELLFISNEDLKAPSKLHRVNLENAHHSSSSTWLPQGPAFHQAGDFGVSYVGPVNRSELRYSLFFESGFDEALIDHFVFDRRDGHQLSFFIPDSFAEPSLYLDLKPTGIQTNSARLGPKGSIFFFKQEGAERVLYEGQRRLWSIPGYYAKLADVTEEAEVDIVAATEKGVGLFTLKPDGQLIRRSRSDAIVAARRINEKQALVSEVYSEGYRYKIIQLEEIKMGPSRLSQSEPRVELPASPKFELPNQLEPYNGLLELQYSSLTPAYGWSSVWGASLALLADFNDPLLNHSVQMFYGRDEAKNQLAALQYSNTSYVLEWSFLASYYDERKYEIVDKKTELRDLSSLATAGFSFYYPLMVSRLARWGISLDEFWMGDTKLMNSFVQLLYVHSIRYPLNFLPYQQWRFGLQAENEGSTNLYGAYFSYLRDLGYEWVISSAISGRQANRASIEVSKPSFKPFRESLMNYASSYSDTVESISSAKLRLDKVFTTGLMPYKFPIGLRRIVPFVSVAGHQVRGGSLAASDRFAELSTGVLLEVIFNHKFEIPISLEGATIPNRISEQTVGMNAGFSW